MARIPHRGVACVEVVRRLKLGGVVSGDPRRRMPPSQVGWHVLTLAGLATSTQMVRDMSTPRLDVHFGIEVDASALNILWEIT